MNFSLLPSSSAFGNTFGAFFNDSHKPYSSFAPLSFTDFDSKNLELLPAKHSKTDDESPCDFFTATRQSTDMTSFSENTPMDISNFFDMQGGPQPSSNFSLIDSINWDNNYPLSTNQALQQNGYSQSEFKDDVPMWTNNAYVEQNKEVEEENSDEEAQGNEQAGEWDEKESDRLIKLAEQYKNDWKKIAKMYNNKRYTPNFLKGKYKEAMAFSAQKRIKFTHKEDLMIAFYFEKYGSNWNKMATFFQNRTGIMLKNRYYSFIRKRNLLSDLIKEGKGFEVSEKNENCQGTPADSDANTNMESYYASEINAQDADSSDTIIQVTVRKENDKQQKEIKLLNMKIRSLQALCVATRKELEGLKRDH